MNLVRKPKKNLEQYKKGLINISSVRDRVVNIFNGVKNVSRICILISIGIACFLNLAFAEKGPQGTAYSQPNVSGGYDFYDSSGTKTGSSSTRPDGGYDYYDKHGNWTGSLKTDAEKGTYEYYDYENIKRGTGKIHPYGGYQYHEQKEGMQTPEQANIRRDHKYKDTYGSGIETLPPDVLQGKD